MISSPFSLKWIENSQNLFFYQNVFKVKDDSYIIVNRMTTYDKYEIIETLGEGTFGKYSFINSGWSLLSWMARNMQSNSQQKTMYILLKFWKTFSKNNQVF